MYNSPLQKPSSAESLKQYEGLDVVGLDVVVGFVVVCLDVGFVEVGFVVVCLDVVGLDVVGFVVGFLGGSVGDNCSCSWRRFLLLLWPRIVSCSLNEDMRAKSEAPYSWSTDAWWEELGDSLDPWSTDAGINDVV